jgi:leader peptidase (prepilin peptidase) / N-methyltransferase
MADPDGPLALVVLPPWGWVVAAVLGALWGSFFNVAIHRLGLYESVVRPRSRCPRCGAPISARDNIPIFGWMLLGGKCRNCKQPISARYPLVEALSAGLALAVYAAVALPAGEPVSVAAHFLVYFAFVGALVVVAGVDLDHKIIPDSLTYPAIPAFFVCQLVLRDVAPLELLLGMAIGYGIIAVIAELVYWAAGREGMGYGDAKLLMLVGAFLGWRAVAFTLVAGSFIGVLVLVPTQILRRRRLFGVEVPFGPFLCAGALLYIFGFRQILAILFG